MRCQRCRAEVFHTKTEQFGVRHGMSWQSCCLSTVGSPVSRHLCSATPCLSVLAPQVLCRGYTLTPGIVMKVLQNLQKFRVPVWMSYRIYRGSGYGYKTLTELTEVQGIVTRAYRTHISSGKVLKRCTGTPGILKRGVQNLQRFRVPVKRSYRTYRSSGYGYEYLT